MSCHRFEVAGDMQELQYAMKMFRCGFKTIGGIRVEDIITDHTNEAGVSSGCGAVEYRLEGGSAVTMKQAGSGSALEICISAADGGSITADMEKRICADIENIVNIDYRAGYCCE